MAVFHVLRPLRSIVPGFRLGNPASFLLALMFAGFPSAPAVAADVAGLARVIDGDTLVIDGETIRLFGIDAPERGQVCRAYDTPYPCGLMAIAWLVENTLGATVVCRDSRRDQWRRLIAVCSVDGQDLAERLVGAGWAVADRRYSDRYVPVEAGASERRIGLWIGTFVSPLDWRRGERTAGFKPSAGP